MITLGYKFCSNSNSESSVCNGYSFQGVLVLWNFLSFSMESAYLNRLVIYFVVAFVYLSKSIKAYVEKIMAEGTRAFMLVSFIYPGHLCFNSANEF